MLVAVTGGFGPFLDEEVDVHDPNELLPEGDTSDTGLGACQPGVLHDGVQLHDVPGLFTMWNLDRSWGTPQLVDVIERGAEEVRWLVPDSQPLVIGDMSLEHGGYFAGHKSHREGLDADIGIFSGHAQQTHLFNDLDATSFDAASTWVLIRSFLKTGLVERILLDDSLIQLLRKHVASTGELDAAEIEQIFPRRPEERWGRDGVVHHAAGHRNHLHLRVLCSP